MKIEINKVQYLELEKIANGAFVPLTGFMTERELQSCIRELRLPTGEIFPIPVVLDAPKSVAKMAVSQRRITLHHESEYVGCIYPNDSYEIPKEEMASQVFGTTDPKHPGVAHLFDLKEFAIGGSVEMVKKPLFEFSNYEATPQELKMYFKEMGWNTVTGFQTRNAPHRAHEYLQRVALEVTDGLLIQPLVGLKKAGDFTPEAILKGYAALIDNYYPRNRVRLAILSTTMRYAGPREAIFHALIRRNYGCTHFIIGRDHAGVSDYYEIYAAQKLAKQYETELGITILDLKGPFFCNKCESIVTEKTCRHKVDSPQSVMEISGTDVRERLVSGGPIDSDILREEVLAELRKLDPFI